MEKLKQLSAFVSFEIYKKIKLLSAEELMTIQDLLLEAINDLLRKKNKI